MRVSILRNAIANLGRGGVAGIVALVLPPVLLRHMVSGDYAVWVLVLQVAAYMGYLDFGLQTAVGRYIALASEKKDEELRDGIFSTAFAGLSLAAVLGIFLILVAMINSHRIFPQIPISLLGPMRAAMLVVGVSVALGLPASAWNGVFVGLQRYEIPAISAGVAKILSAAGLIVAAVTGKSLVLMACVVAATNIFSYIAQFFLLRRVAPSVRFRSNLITAPLVRELFGYCLSLTVWSFSMLLVNGFDLILVGRFQFDAVTPYAVSVTLITFLAGVQNAIFGVIMPHAAAMYARQDSEGLGALLIKATKLGVLLLLVTGLPLVVFATPIIRMWIGPQFGQVGGSLLTVLVIANIVRLAGSPYASILIGTGQQRLVVVSPLLEGVANLLSSLFLGMKYGAMGVAWGTLIGAIVGMSAHAIYNVMRTKAYIDISRRKYITDGLLVPCVCGFPVCIAPALAYMTRSSAPMLMTYSLVLSILTCLVLAVRIARVNRGAWS